jgi:hypothetical protein
MEEWDNMLETDKKINFNHGVEIQPVFETVHLESHCALIKCFGSDVHECLYRPEPV